MSALIPCRQWTRGKPTDKSKHHDIFHTIDNLNRAAVIHRNTLAGGGQNASLFH